MGCNRSHIADDALSREESAHAARSSAGSAESGTWAPFASLTTRGTAQSSVPAYESEHSKVTERSKVTGHTGRSKHSVVDFIKPPAVDDDPISSTHIDSEVYDLVQVIITSADLNLSKALQASGKHHGANVPYMPPAIKPSTDIIDELESLCDEALPLMGVDSEKDELQWVHVRNPDLGAQSAGKGYLHHMTMHGLRSKMPIPLPSTKLGAGVDLSDSQSSGSHQANPQATAIVEDATAGLSKTVTDALAMKPDLAPETPPPEPEPEITIMMSVAPGMKLGLDLELKKDPNGSGEETLLITKIKTGSVDTWNSKNPDQAVQVGDRICAVNGVRGKSKRLIEQMSQDNSGCIQLTILRDAPALASARV